MKTTSILTALLMLVAIPHTAAAQTAMSVVDFKTDRAGMIGKSVQLSGLLSNFTEGGALLMAEIGDLNPVWISIAGLDREQRRGMLACNGACKGTVQGTVTRIRGQIGLTATSLKID